MNDISLKSHESLQLGSHFFDWDRLELLDGEGRPVALRAQSVKVLAELARTPGRTVSKSALIDAIWGEVAVTDGSLAQCVADIRRALGEDGRPCIRTVPRRGYRLEPTVTRSKAATSIWRRPGLTAMIAAVLIFTVATLLVRGSADREKATVATNVPTIAVLPFLNMGSDPDQLYFSDGLTEDLITDLSGISGLRMISRASSFTYRDSMLPPRTIADELSASHLVTGSVRRDGGRVRITATLTDVASGANIWAHRYDRDIGGIFDLQDDVTRAITAALAIELTSSEEERFQRHRNVDPDAYEFLLRGLTPLRSFTKADTEEARRYFQRAIEIQPDYARAHANLALTHARSFIFRMGEDKEAIDIALREAELAASLDETIPQVQFALAVAYLSARRHDSAIDAARQAVRLDPNYADGYAVLAQMESTGGDLDAALDAIRAAKTLSPRHLFDYLWVEGHILFQMRRYAEARPILEEVIERNPTFFVGQLTLAATYGHLRETEEADWLVAEILTMEPKFSAVTEGSYAPYRDEVDRNHFVVGLIRAGLPE